MKYRISCVIFIVTIIIATNVFCAQPVDRIAAVVNNEIITLSELKETAKEAKSNDYSKILNQMIESKLIDQKMQESKLETTDDELAMGIKRILMQSGMTIDRLHAEVQKQGMTYEEYTKRLRKELARNKFINQVVASQIKVDERDLRDFYNQHRDIYKGEFDKERDYVYEAVYNEKLPEALSIYLAKLKRESFISIKDEALVLNNR